MSARRSPLMIIFVTVFIDLLGFGIVLPLLPRYAKSFSASTLELALLMASFSAMQFVFAPIWGRISDRIGRRPVLLLGLAGSTVFYGLFGLATGLGPDGLYLGMGVIPWLLVTRVGAGIAGATIPTAQAFIADTTGVADRTKGMALIGAAFGIGFTFGPLIGAAFVDNDPNALPSGSPGYVASALSGFAFLWALARLPESLKPGESSSAGSSHLRNLGLAFTSAGIGMVLLTMFMTTFAFAQFETTLALLTREFGAGDRDNFYLFAYVGLVLSISQGGLIRRLATRMPPARLAAGGTLVMVVGLALIGIAGRSSVGAAESAVATASVASDSSSAVMSEPSAAEATEPEKPRNDKALWLLYLCVPVAVVGFSAVNPSLQSLLSLRTSADRQGEILGVGQSMSAMARILGPVSSMYLFDKVDMAAPYFAGAGLMLIGLLLVVTCGRESDVPGADSASQQVS